MYDAISTNYISLLLSREGDYKISLTTHLYENNGVSVAFVRLSAAESTIDFLDPYGCSCLSEELSVFSSQVTYTKSMYV